MAAREISMAGVLVLAALLGGCVETAGPQAKALDVTGAIAGGDARGPRPTTMTLASLDGAPSPVLDRLRQDLASSASRRDIAMTDAAGAHYFLRGYLDASPSQNGTTVRTVWDLFDASKQRLRRVEDAVELPAADGDPWSGVGDPVLAAMAERSGDAIASALAATPEAGGGAEAATGTAQPSVN